MVHDIWYFIFDIWYFIFDIYISSHSLGGSLFSIPETWGKMNWFCIPGRAGRLWWWGGWRGSASGEDTWAAPVRATWMWYPRIVRSMNHGISRCTLICFFLGDSPKKTSSGFPQKKQILPLFSTNFPSFPMAVFVVATFGIFFHLHSVMGSEKPWFTKERRSRVYTFPADARRSWSQDWPIPWISVVQVTDHLQTTTFHTQGCEIHHISLAANRPCWFLSCNRNHRFVYKSRVSIFRFFW